MELASAAPEGSPIEEALAALRGEGWSERYVIFERELAAETDPIRRAALEHELGELREFHGSDEAAALRAYGHAFAADPGLLPNLWAIRRVCARRGLWPNLIKLVDAELARASDPTRRSELLVEKGEVLEDRLDDASGARQAFEQAALEDPRSLPALMALEKIAAREQDPTALVGIYRRMVDATDDPGRKVALLLDIARSDSGAARDAETAGLSLVVLREAFALGVEQERVLDEIERVCEATGRTDELIAAIDARIALRAARPDSGEAVAALRRRQARIAAGLPDGAARARGFLEEGLRVAPDEPVLLADLGQLAEAEGRLDDLADLIGRRAARAGGDARPGLLLELAAALRRAGRDAEAESAEAEIPSQAGEAQWIAFARLRRAERVGDAAAVARMYRLEAERALVGDTPTAEVDRAWAADALCAAGAAIERAADAGAILEERYSAAIECYRGALELYPDHGPAFDGLDHALARAGRHAERDRLLTGRLEDAAPALRAHLLQSLVALRQEDSGDLAGALSACESLCELRGGEPRTRLRVVELAFEAGRFRDAANHLGLLAERHASDGFVAAALNAQLARAGILERHVGAPDEAAAVTERILRVDPGHAQAASVLRRLLAGPGQEARLAAALRSQIDAGPDDPVRADRLRFDLADLQRRTSGASAVGAVEQYLRILEGSPGDPAALRALGEIYERSADDGRLAEVLEAAAAAALPEHGGARALKLLEVGELHERRGEEAAADDAFARAIAADPGAGSGAGWHAALGRFRIGARRRDPAALESALAPLAGAVDRSVAAVAREERAFQIGVAGSDAEAGWRLIEAVDGTLTDSGPAARAAGLALSLTRAHLAARRGDSAALADALDRLAGGLAGRAPGDGAAPGAPSRAAAALGVRAGLLGAAAGALPAVVGARLEAAFDAAPADGVAVMAASSHADHPEALARRASIAPTARAAEWSHRRAEALAARGRIAEAAAEIEGSLERTPGHLGLLDLARRLAAAAGDRAGLALASAHLGVALSDRARSAASLAEAARLFDQLGDSARALPTWESVLERVPTDEEAFARAHALRLEQRDDAGIERLLGHRIAALAGSAGSARVPLLIERAARFAGAGRTREAIADLRGALAIEPSQLEALRALGPLLAEAGDADGAVAALSAFVDGASNPGELRAAHLLQAGIERARGRLAEAAEAYRRFFSLGPSPEEARGARENMIETSLATRDFAAAAAVLRDAVEASSVAGDRASLSLRLADLLVDHLGDVGGGRDALLRTLEERPEDLEALARLVPLCEAHGDTALRDTVLDRAIATERSRVAREARNPLVYRALARMLEWRRDPDPFAAQAAALAAGEPHPHDDMERDPTHEMSAPTFERLMGPVALGPGLQLWRLANEVATKVIGLDLGRLGAEKSERQNAKGIPVAWIPVDKIARALGAQGYELYRSPLGRDVARVTGNALVLGSAHAERLTGATRFRVARKLVLLRERLGPVETADLIDLELFFAACARVAGVLWSPPVRPEVVVPAGQKPEPTREARLEERVKAVSKAIDRKTRKAIAAAAPTFLGLDVAAWRDAVLSGAARIALAVGGDLGAALEELKLHFDSEEGRELTRFALSDEIGALRRELGLRG